MPVPRYDQLHPMAPNDARDVPDEARTLAILEANGWAADLDYDRRREAELSPAGREPGCELHGRPDCDICNDYGQAGR